MEAEICALVPSDWQIRSVEDVCKRVTSGGTPSRTRPDFYANGSWPWVKTQELQDTWIDHTEEKITDEAVANSSAKVLPPHTILLAMYGATVGQLGILRSPMTCNQACCAMIVDSDKADFRYLYYHLRYSRPQLKSLATGAAQQNLSGALIKSLLYPFPPLAEQKAIAAVLGALDDKIELNRRMNATLEAMARALFQSWFADFDPVRAKLDGRQPAHLDPATAALFPDSFHDSALGPIPNGWEVCPLSEKIKLLSGGTPKTSEPSYWDGDIPWYSVKDAPAETDVWVIHTEKRVTKEGIANSAAQILPEGTTIISARGTVGKLALIGTPMAMNQSCYGVRGINGYGDFFTYFALRQATADLQQRTHGTVFDTITRQTFETLDCIFPPANLTAAFDRTVAPLLAQIRANLHQSRTLATLRDALLPKLLSGELSVAAVSATMEAAV
jgi:type I restriction enzyme S subunit